MIKVYDLLRMVSKETNNNITSEHQTRLISVLDIKGELYQDWSQSWTLHETRSRNPKSQTWPRRYQVSLAPKFFQMACTLYAPNYFQYFPGPNSGINKVVIIINQIIKGEDTMLI